MQKQSVNHHLAASKRKNALTHHHIYNIPNGETRLSARGIKIRCCESKPWCRNGKVSIYQTEDSGWSCQRPVEETLQFKAAIHGKELYLHMSIMWRAFELEKFQGF